MNPFADMPKILWNTFLSLWEFWVFALVFLTLTSLPGLYRRWRLRQAGMDEIDRMGGIEFEQYLEDLFRRLGYQVQRTRAVGDQGADLILTGNGERIVVQAKRWSKRVGNKAIQEAAAARPHYRCDRAMVVSNQEFTASARELAASNQIELWGRRLLAERIIALNSAPNTASSRPGPLPKASPIPTPIVSQTAARSCPRCGQQLVKRHGKRGSFWGCSGYPNCRYTEDS